MTSKLFSYFLASMVLLGSCSPGGQGSPTVIRGAGDIAAVVDEYRNRLGPDNGTEPGSKGPTGYREINWDGVPDELAAPNFLPSDFSMPLKPRGRAAPFSTHLAKEFRSARTLTTQPGQHLISQISIPVTHLERSARNDSFRL